MNDEHILKKFKNLLSETLSTETNYALKLAEILDTSPDTISQKLEGKTHFTLGEVIKISKYLNISLDNLYDHNQNDKRPPLELYIHDFHPEKAPGIISYSSKEAYRTIDCYSQAAKSDYSTYLVASNTIPEIIYLNYEWLAKFYYIRWLYFNKGPMEMVELSTVNFTDKEGKIKKYSEAIIGISHCIYIFNINMMQFILEEIRFFHSLKYITTEEVKKLTEELDLLMNEGEKICTTGVLPHSGKDIDIFYSEIHLANDLAIMDSTNIKFATILSFFLNSIVTNSSENFHIVKGWFDSLIRSSHLISVKGEDKRKYFFDKQRKVLNQFILEL